MSLTKGAVVSTTSQGESPLERLKRLRKETAQKLEPSLVEEVSELPSGEGLKGTKVPHRRTDKSLGVVAVIHDIEPHSSEETGLVAAGWTLKGRLGKNVWQSPENGFWYSQEMALALLGYQNSGAGEGGDN